MAAEKNYENHVKKFLKGCGCWMVKYWGGAAYTKAGVPDLLVCCSGRFIGIELKGQRGRPSDLQLHNLKQIDNAGGYAVLLYPADYELFQNFIRCIVAGDGTNASLNYELLKSKWVTILENKIKGE